MSDQTALDNTVSELLPGTILDRKTQWYIEMQQPDGSWMGCTSTKSEPEDLSRTWNFREDTYPEDKHRIVQVDVLVQVGDVEEIRKLIPQKTDETEKTAVHSD